MTFHTCYDQFKYQIMLFELINAFTTFQFYINHALKLFLNICCMIDNKIHLYMMSTTNLLILFCVWIKVRRVKRFQFDAVQMMLKHCVIRKVIMQSFHLHNNISSNSHNWFMKKTNDMSMLVKDEKILLVK